MTVKYFLFIIIFILLTPSDKTFTFSDTNERITYEFIHDICSKTRNPPLCMNTLNSLRGARLSPKPLAVLATRPIIAAHSYANRTARAMWDHYRATRADRHGPRQTYKMCVHEYADAMKQLDKAKKSLPKGEGSSVKIYTRAAVGRADTCGVGLIEPPWANLEANKRFFQATAEFKDHCDIIMEICNKLSDLLDSS